MPTLDTNFIGAMDLDSPDQDIDPRMVRSTRNVIWRGNPGRMRAETVVGTTIRTNPFLPTSGVNKCISAFYDDVDQLLFDFNFNSLGTSAIYIYNTLTQAWQVLLQVGTNTVGDPLGFLASPRIQGVRIIYGDPNDGNLLFFLNSGKVPTKINYNRYLTAPPTNIERSFLEVIKAPPAFPVRCVYENDFNVGANNCANSLFQFAETFIYDDFEESVIGIPSEVPLPTVTWAGLDTLTKSQNARIAVYMNTGDQTVKKIRLYMRQTQNGVTSGWFIVDTISKVGNGIGDNDQYRYLFYNSGNFVPADPKFTVLLQDNVPLQANAQELLNGDTLAYGGLTEGYDWFKSQFSFNITDSASIYSIGGFLFFAAPDGTFSGTQPNIKLIVTGAGTNNAITGDPTALGPNHALTYFVNAISDSTNISFSSSTALATVAGILAQLVSDAVGAGWSVAAPTDPNSVRIYYPTGTVTLKSSYYVLNGGPGFLLLQANPRFVHYEGSNYSYGVMYFDKYGRTIGAITDVTANITTLASNYISGNIAPISTLIMNLNGIIPPAWADTYSIIRTDTLTYSKYETWVSNRTLSGTGTTVLTKYAYIDISNIDEFNLREQATQGVIGYEFQQGDRIRFNALYKVSGPTVYMNNDYSIIGEVENPVINGQPQLGRFIKINYPTGDISTDFDFQDTYDFANYNITIYHIAANSAPQTANTGTSAAAGNVYYEIGMKFGIGNKGQITAYHFGNISDNQVRIQDGDVFYRNRTVSCINTYYLYAAEGAFSNRYTLLDTRLQPTPDVFTPLYTVSSQPHAPADAFNPAVYPTYADAGGLLVNNSSNSLNVRLRGSAQFTQTDPNGTTWMDIVVKKVGPTGTTVGAPFILVHSDNVTQGTSVIVEFDQIIELASGWKMWLLFGNGQTKQVLISGFMLRMDIIRDITIKCYDRSYSDIYNIITNNDGRVAVQDTTAKTTFYNTLLRFGRNYQVGTTLNNTNRFYPNDFDEFDKSHGSIIRFRTRQRELRIFQERRCGHTGIYSKYISDNSGTKTLITTDAIITPNNVDYYEGEYGIGNQPDSLASSGHQDYFADPVKGYWCRLSQDGVYPISELFKIQTYAGDNLPNYLSDYVYQFGGTSVILGCYHFSKDRSSEVIFCLQGGTSGMNTIVGESVAFKEEGNAWTSFYDFAPDAIVNCENKLFSFSNGVLYCHDNEALYCNFYGNQFAPFVDVIKNQNEAIDKGWIGVSLLSKPQWKSPLVYTDSYSYPGQRQESNIVDEDYTLAESHYKASLRNDINSIGGISNGQRLKGSLIFIRFTVTDGSQFSYLAHVQVKLNVSQLVLR